MGSLFSGSEHLAIPIMFLCSTLRDAVSTWQAKWLKISKDQVHVFLIRFIQVQLGNICNFLGEHALSSLRSQASLKELREGGLWITVSEERGFPLWKLKYLKSSTPSWYFQTQGNYD